MNITSSARVMYAVCFSHDFLPRHGELVGSYEKDFSIKQRAESEL